ncbi:unnamed protein product, partial [Cylicostephanus goldi]
MERVIALIDMDCFFVQVEQREKPELWGKPVVLAVFVVSYEARSAGVKRKMTISQAKAICYDLNVDASAEIFDVFNNFDERIIVERASVDEAFLDMTELVDQTILEFGAAQLLQNLTSNLSTTLPTTHVADGNDRGNEDVYNREASLRNWLDNRCATEISHLPVQMLAKLICARHKPRHQTIIPFDYVPVIFGRTRVGDIR